MKKRFWATLLSLVMVLSLLPTSAFAATHNQSYEFKANTSYGQSGDDIYWNHSTKTLYLTDANITSSGEYGIKFNCNRGDKVTIILAGSNSIHVNDRTSGDEKIKGAIFVKAHSLTITSAAPDYAGTLALSTGVANSDNYGIYYDNEIYNKDGNISLNITNVRSLSISTGGSKNASTYGVWTTDTFSVNVTNSYFNVETGSKGAYRNPFFAGEGRYEADKVYVNLNNSSFLLKNGGGDNPYVARKKDNGVVKVDNTSMGNPDATGNGYSGTTGGTIIYKDGTSTLKTDNVTNGALGTVNYTPSNRNGYTFKGWSTTSGSTTATHQNDNSVNLLAQQNNTLTLYAVWEPIKYTVEFKANGGTGSMSPQSFTYDEAAKALTANTFSRTGYTFEKWTTNADGTGTSYTDKQEVQNLTAENSKTITLCAQWKANTYTVNFDANGGSGTMSGQNFTYDVKQALSGNTFTNTGMKFVGWATSENGSVTYSDGATVENLTDVNEGTVTLYAKWEQDDTQTTNKRYTVEYYKDDVKQGEDTTVTKTVYVNAAVLPVENGDLNVTDRFDGCEFEKIVIDGTTYTNTNLPQNVSVGATVKVYYKTKEKPSDDELKTLFPAETVKVVCGIVPASHTEKAYPLKEGSYNVSSVTGTGSAESPYTCTVTINAAKYVTEYNNTNSGHTADKSEQSKTVTLKYVDKAWTLPAGFSAVTFNVTCEMNPDHETGNLTITKALGEEAPDEASRKQFQFDVLNASGQKVGETITITGAGSKSIHLDAGTYYVMELPQSSGVKNYSVKTTYQVGSGEASITPTAFTISGEQSAPVTVTVTNTYTPYTDDNTNKTYKVTYVFSGDAPDVGVPQNATLYQGGETVTLPAVSSVNGTKNGLPGVWTFNGWTVPEGIAVESGKFTMPEQNVTITGTWSFSATPVPPVITYNHFFAIQKIDGQSGASLSGAVFELYQVNASGEKINVRRATSGANGLVSFSLTSPSGTWYISEVAAPAGYLLDNAVYSLSSSDFSSTSSAAAAYAMVVRNYRDNTPAMLNSDDHYAYVVGYADGTVRPNGLISRADATTIFFRLLTDAWRDSNLRYTNDFTDVSDSYWANTAISTMAGLGIVEGFADGTFDPTAPITRAQFAAICARFDTTPESGTASSFTDTQGHWAEKYIQRAVELGWVQGFEDGTFRPDEYITRAQAMTMINRILGRTPESEDDLLDEMTVWPDCNPGDWYYLAVQEATNSHSFSKKSGNYEHWTGMKADPDWSRYEN